MRTRGYYVFKSGNEFNSNRELCFFKTKKEAVKEAKKYDKFIFETILHEMNCSKKEYRKNNLNLDDLAYTNQNWYNMIYAYVNVFLYKSVLEASKSTIFNEHILHKENITFENDFFNTYNYSEDGVEDEDELIQLVDDFEEKIHDFIPINHQKI